MVQWPATPACFINAPLGAAVQRAVVCVARVRWGRWALLLAARSTAYAWCPARRVAVEERLARWRRVIHHARRLAFRRRLWAHLGQLLQDVARRGRSGGLTPPA